MKLGVLAQTEGMRKRDLVEFAHRLERLGIESLWLPELFGREPVATAGYLLGQTDQLHLATGIANVYVRDAHAMAQTRATLAELSDGRFILGLGVSNAGLNGTRGHAWEMPLPKMRTYLQAMDAAAIDAPRADDLAPVHVAAHGPKLQTLGAERADGIITYLMPPEHTVRSREHVGSETQVTVACPFIAETDPAIARGRARKALRYYLILDYYHREWSQLGFGAEDFSDGGSERLIDTLVAWGSGEALQARVEAYRQAGADRVIIIPLDKPNERDSIAVLSESMRVG